jgi:hypothetical protein
MVELLALALGYAFLALRAEDLPLPIDISPRGPGFRCYPQKSAVPYLTEVR